MNYVAGTAGQQVRMLRGPGRKLGRGRHHWRANGARRGRGRAAGWPRWTWRLRPRAEEAEAEAD